MSRDHRWRLGPLLLWWGGGSTSIHVRHYRLLWVRDTQRWPSLFSEREGWSRYQDIGRNRVRWMETA